MTMLQDRLRKQERTYSSVEVARLTGASYRMLDHWSRQGYIPGQHEPVGSGHHRVWTLDQLDRVRLLMMASEIKAAPLDDLAERISGHPDCPLCT